MADLTTIEAVRSYLKTWQAEDPQKLDPELLRLIPAISTQVRTDTGRALEVPPTSRTETHDGDGGCRLLLDEYPVTAITSVTVDGVAIPVRPSSTGSGYVLRDAAIGELVLVGYTFTRGVQNVVVVYRAGYEATQAGTIPANPGPYTIQAGSTWRGDVGVTINAVAGTKVTGAPAAGQYAVDAAGLYTFAAADTGKAVVLTFGIVPADLEHAVRELVALAVTDQDHIGQSYRVVSGEVVDFKGGAQLAHARAILDSYRRPGVG